LPGLLSSRSRYGRFKLKRTVEIINYELVVSHLWCSRSTFSIRRLKHKVAREQHLRLEPARRRRRCKI
jgi:hypothetical protein